MPLDWCEKCGRLLTGNARREVEICMTCERLKEKEIADMSEFVNKQPTLSYEDGLTYVIEPQPVFDD